MQFTLAEAVTMLHPPISERRLRAIIAALPGFTADGARRDGRPGHPHPTYQWAELAKLHAAITPWLNSE